MSTFDYNLLKQRFLQFEQTNICNVCCVKFADPVRIKTCGHYFCEKCLEINSKNEQCPKCKEHYERNEVDYQNAARKLQICMDEFRTFLSNATEIQPESNLGMFKENLFIYMGKKFHLNYLDDLFKKVNNKGESALHIACKKKKLDDVQNLLGNDIDINIQDFAGWAPLVCI